MSNRRPLKSNEKLKQERILRNWRQREVADMLGTTMVTIRRWEQGRQQPGAFFRTKLCNLFGKSAEELGLLEAAGPVTTANRAPLEQPEPGPVAVPELWAIPYPRNPHFTGREELLALLDQQLSQKLDGDPRTMRHMTLTQSQAIKGLGGIGKTQIAIEYAYRSRERGDYTYTLWINAASEESIVTSFTGLAEVLPDFSASEEKDQRKLILAVKRWLEACPQSWLLIFDNADDLSLLKEYIPSNRKGSLLFTTRAHAAGAVAPSLDVEKMGFIEGTQMLLKRAQRFTNATDEEINEAGNIVVALDHFPLALDQAGAYIEETGCTFSTYLQLYQNHRKALLTRRGNQINYYPDSVATTWSLSLQKVEQANPAAAELLRLCAFLAPDHIPEELIREGAPQWPAALQKTTSDFFAFNQMLEDLLTFSLIKRLAGDHMLSIHRLVQAVQMDAMQPEERQQWVERVIRAVHIIFPVDPRLVASRPVCLRYLEQAQACDTLIRQYDLLLPEAADILYRTGAYLHDRVSNTVVEALYLQAIDIYEKTRGPEYLGMAPSLHRLALIHELRGTYEQASQLLQRLLSIREKALGHEHADVAATLDCMANIYLHQAEYPQAKALYQEALRIWEKTLGPEHPDIAASLEGLAVLYTEQKHFAQAEGLLKRSLAIREKALGPEHPDVAASLNNLASCYQDQGRYAEAEELCNRAVQIWEQKLGPEHPYLSYALDSLAVQTQEQGKYELAEQYYERALYIREQFLGTATPDVAITLAHFAELRIIQQRFTEAEDLYRRSYAIRKQVLGPQHAYTIETRNQLYDALRAQGKTEAEAQQITRRLEEAKPESL